MAMNYDSLTARITELQGRLPVERNKLAGFKQSLSDWQTALATDQSNGASSGTISHSQKRIAEEQQKVNDQTTLVAGLENELTYSLDLRKKIDDAAATAIANGSTPEAAYQVAIAEVMRAETVKKIVTVGGIVLLIVGAIALFIWWRRKGKKLAA